MDNYLQQGVAAAKAGDRSRAFDLLTQASEIPATSEQAWLWLSSVVNDDSERLFCLNNVLRINPVNTAAQRGAEMLKQKGISPAMPVYPESQNKAAVRDINPAPAPSQFASSSLMYAAPTRTQTSPVPVIPPKHQQQPSYETDWKKQEISGYFEYAVMELANKKSYKAVEKSLVNRGASPEVAKTVVKEADDAVCKARRAGYKKRMTRGFLWMVVGIVITCGTYVFADSLGGKYYLFYGAIIVGFIDLVIGLIGWLANW
ncbi:MAG: hypothetical protein IH588_05825 [Anaerolineales bacterium]|nr:hypothetical protein [Anaerolineales bacterium]